MTVEFLPASAERSDGVPVFFLIVKAHAKGDLSVIRALDSTLPETIANCRDAFAVLTKIQICVAQSKIQFTVVAQACRCFQRGN